MIISRTPFRISFFGGGTDFPQWYRQHGGAVLATTIDKYCYLSVRYLPPFFDYRYRVVYSKIETVSEISEIQHPAVRAVLQTEGIEKGLVIHHEGDLPARTGLGSSSSFSVGLIHAIRALKGQMSNKQELANAAIHLEQNVLKESVGSQDQILAAIGGLNKIVFHRDGSYEVIPVTIPQEKKQWLEKHLLLFYTGISRFSTEIAKSTIENIAAKERQLHEMHQMVDDALNILKSPSAPLSDFGHLLHETWLRKQSLSEKITTPFINEIYEVARKAGVLGGKLLGAGGGGFILLFVEPPNQARVREKLKHLVHVPFQFENQGTQIVMYHPEGYE